MDLHLLLYVKNSFPNLACFRLEAKFFICQFLSQPLGWGEIKTKVATMVQTNFKDPEMMSFEEAMAELEQVVRQLEEGRVPLEQAIESYERGAALKARCDMLLNKARLKVEEIIQKGDGTLATRHSELQDLLEGE
jgi:exodeoxyribonuclease VII small subunit